MSKLNLKTLNAGDRVRISHNGKVVEEDFVVGSLAGHGALAGAFCWRLYDGSGALDRDVGGRVDEETGAWYADRGWAVERRIEMSTLNLKTLKRGDRIRISHNGEVVEDDFVFGGVCTVRTPAGAFGWVLNDDSGYLGLNVGGRSDGETGAVYADRGWEVELLEAAKPQKKMVKAVIETVAVIRRRYYIEAPDAQWGGDAIVMNEIDSFSTQEFSEDVTSVTVVDEFPYLAKGDSINAATYVYNEEMDCWLEDVRWDLQSPNFEGEPS